MSIRQSNNTRVDPSRYAIPSAEELDGYARGYHKGRSGGRLQGVVVGVCLGVLLALMIRWVVVCGFVM